MPTKPLSDDLIRRMPKVLLHEHLDGCLRPATVLELAREADYKGLPEGDAERLGRWFFEGADRGSLPQYLEGFRHTIAVMQSASALERVAYELCADLAAENVVYFEVRFAPHFHIGWPLAFGWGNPLAFAGGIPQAVRTERASDSTR